MSREGTKANICKRWFKGERLFFFFLFSFSLLSSGFDSGDRFWNIRKCCLCGFTPTGVPKEKKCSTLRKHCIIIMNAKCHILRLLIRTELTLIYQYGFCLIKIKLLIWTLLVCTNNIMLHTRKEKHFCEYIIFMYIINTSYQRVDMYNVQTNIQLNFPLLYLQIIPTSD